MEPIDWVIAGVLAVSVVCAARKGFIVETFSLVGVVLGLLLASWNYQRVIPWATPWIHRPPIAAAVCFMAIAFAVMVLTAIVGRLVRWSVKSVGLGFADRFLGAIFGLVKGCVLVTIAIMVMAAFFPATTWLRHSLLAPYFLSMAHTTTAVTPSDLGARIRSGVKIIGKAQPDWLKPSADATPQHHQLDNSTDRIGSGTWNERGMCEA